MSATAQDAVSSREPGPMLTDAWFFDRFTQGAGVSRQEHVRVFWSSPSVENTREAANYLAITHGLTTTSTVIQNAVRSGELVAFKIGKAYVFRPADLDAWLASRRVNG